MPTLQAIVANLSSYDDDLTIYAVRPWHCRANAVVALEPDDGAVPDTAAACGAVYFLEVSVAKDFLNGWSANQQREVSPEEQCERLIRYAVDDA